MAEYSVRLGPVEMLLYHENGSEESVWNLKSILVDGTINETIDTAITRMDSSPFRDDVMELIRERRQAIDHS